MVTYRGSYAAKEESFPPSAIVSYLCILGRGDIRGPCASHPFQEAVMRVVALISRWQQLHHAKRAKFPNTSALTEWFLIPIQPLFFFVIVLGAQIWGRYYAINGSEPCRKSQARD